MTWLAALVVFMLVFAGMAIGVMLGRKPISGSCGGVGNSCELCGGNPQECDRQN